MPTVIISSRRRMVAHRVFFGVPATLILPSLRVPTPYFDLFALMGLLLLDLVPEVRLKAAAK